MKTLFLELIMLVILPISAMTLYEDIYTLRHLYALALVIYFCAFKRHPHLPAIKTMFRLPPCKVIFTVISISLLASALLFLLHYQNHKLIDDMVLALVTHPHLKFLGLIAYPLFPFPSKKFSSAGFFSTTPKVKSTSSLSSFF